ncbi:HNH endonuclease signature motif containing protein [Glycomyces sp. NRRL B-16210]|uniref:HNH endonuclease signature motif containing protein n=1 Tax=Glycomyces sp. NRRL B-16210 TaxID=1463821 RepID=UPI0004C24E93|nr:HNH endonuclease signature motif containing protein [Glycomyces sp. NRRL B-16210]
MASTLPTAAERRAEADAIRASLDDTAALVNGAYANALRLVMNAFDRNVHRDLDGFAAQRDWLVSNFDFTASAAGNIASIAKLSTKFALLADAALTGYARIDQAAYAANQLNKTPASALFARTPFRALVPSPFDPETMCATPEALVCEYAAHASFRELRRHLAELHAGFAEEAELLDGLGEESVQHFEVQELDEGGMWAVNGLLSATTGALLDKYLKTACPPPRQDETDQYGVLPPQANRNAEAMHQLLAGYGTSPEAVTRHGHTATLDLTVDIETLQGKDTGRLPLLEGRPISVARARLLACEAGVIPSVFDYATGEAVELGRALRLPNTSLRRKLELEQPGGCAWQGCDRPVAWTEAHHIQHWADGGPTVAENLILLCRFHHGRIHTANWSVTKTGPGKAVIVHHDHATGASTPCSTDLDLIEADTIDKDAHGCGCADWRTEADMDEAFAGAAKNFFPTGLYESEWSEAMTPWLESIADDLKEAKAYFDGGSEAALYNPAGLSTYLDDDCTDSEEEVLRELKPPPEVYGVGRSVNDLIPFLGGPPGWQSRRGRSTYIKRLLARISP